MLVEFVLTMEGLDVNDRLIDGLIIVWQQNVSHSELSELTHQWMTSRNFLTSRMVGLQSVGESSLIVDPMEDLSYSDTPL